MYMKVRFLLILVFTTTICVSQVKKQIFLENLDVELLTEINEQGKRLFSKSDCFHKNEEYIVIPEFIVNSVDLLSELNFINEDSLLTKFYFERKSKKKFLNQIRWNVLLRRNPCVLSSSDFKKFYCFVGWNIQTHIHKFEELKLADILYTFYIVGVDLSFNFIVDKNNHIYIYDNKKETFFTLSEFNQLYEKGEIKRFSDNPFENDNK